MVNRYVPMVLLCIVAVGAVSLTLFRYQYVKTGTRTDRVDRLTGSICTMPCVPETPQPTEAPDELSAQRAIEAVKARDDAAVLVAAHSDDSDYRWAAVLSKSEGDAQADSSTYVVCYCKPDTNGFRWEAHLKSHEIFYMNDNANLMRAYNLTDASPTPIAESADAAADASDGSSATPDEPNGTSDDSPQANVVSSFYRAISSKDYGTAYALLSQRYKDGTSYASFVKGYATTQSVDATTHARGDDSNTVDVTLHAVDLKNGGSVDTIYSGYWILVPDGSKSWLLDHGRFSHPSDSSE